MSALAPIGQLILSRTETIVFGPNTVEARLRSVLEQTGIARPFLFSTPSLVKTGMTASVERWIGPSLVGTFYESRAHTPRSLVLGAAEIAKKRGADGLVSLGGSSVVDLAKSVAMVMAEGDDLDAMHIRFSPDTGLVMPPLLARKVPHISIPTTLSGSEYTMAAAISDERRGEKDLYVDPQLVPKTVFHDPSLCLTTPSRLWAGSGMKVLSDCLEMMCSPNAKPFTNMYAMSGLKTLLGNLAPSISETDSAASRQNCLYGAFLALSVAPNASLGLVAGLRHQLGAHQHVSHGDGSTIMLPHVLRWNLAAAEQPMADAARALGLSAEAENRAAAMMLIDAIESLIVQLNLPRRLQDVGVDSSAFAAIAARVVADATVAGNPRKVSHATDLIALLNSAY